MSTQHEKSSMEDNTKNTPRKDSLNTSQVTGKPRLIIHKIVLENFKSYAEKKEIGPFHKSFTSIVGPNGSGKSNVIDAILFVFGKRGSKMRLKKLSELIHHSEKYKNLKSAKVSVYFKEIIDKDNDQYDVVEGSEFVVSRTVDKSSKSTYYINDKKSSFTEVQELLLSKGIDLEFNRFLILQGEVEQIALMKPKAPNEHEDGLLEYIEACIGTQKYKPMIEKAEKIVEELNDERAAKLNSVRAAEREKESLESAKNEAEEYLAKKRQVIKCRVWIYQLYEEKAKKVVAEFTKKKEELMKKYEQETQKLKDAINNSESAAKDYKQAKKDYDKIAKELEKTKAEFASYERKDVKLCQDLKNCKSKEKKLEKEIQTHKEKIESLKQKIVKCKKEEEAAKKALEKIKPELDKAEATVEAIYESLQDEIGPIRVKIEQRQKELMPWSKKVDEIKQKIEIAQSERDLIKQKSESVSQRIKETLEKIDKANEEVKQKTKERETSVRTLKQIVDRIPKLNEELKKVTAEEKTTTEKYQKERAKLEEMKYNVTSAKTRSAAYRAIMSQKEKGAIKGIHDRLGNLGVIDSKYDIAISTACPDLNYIVVETTAAGKKCVEYLVKNKVGIMKFLMIDKIATDILVERSKKKIKTPENVPRLYDLVKPKDEKFKVVFYFALRDTLVAKDLEQASRIAYSSSQRWRVVTLNGELIEASGTISGGGNRVQKGGMAASFTADVSEEDIKKCEANVKQLYDNLLKLKSRKENISAQLKTLEAEQSKLELSIPKLEMDEKAAVVRAKDLEKRLKELKTQPKRAKEDEARIRELQDIIDEHDGELRDAEAKKNALQKKIDKLQEQINEAGGEKLKAFKQKVESLTKEMEETSHKMTKLQVQAATAEKTIPKLEKQIAQDTKELEQLKTKIEGIVKEQKELEASARVVYENFGKTEELLKEREKELVAKEKEYDVYKQKIDKLKEIEEEMKNEMEDLDKSLKDNEKSLNHWAKKIEEMEEQLKEYDDVDEDEEQSTENKTKPQVSYRKSPEELEELDEKKLNYEITILESEMEKMNPNMNAIKDYRAKAKLHEKRLAAFNEITEKRNAAVKEYDALRKKRLDEFMEGFRVITLKLKEIYQMVTLGGDAELELVDSLDPFSEGIVFSVRPPKKSWKNICNLSGGEKTLSSLSLVFALHHFKPTPIYVMDEIDAALDFRNVSIIAHYIQQRTKNCAQFIIISLRNNMFELADILVGIYKTNNITKSVTINPKAIQKKQQQQQQQQQVKLITV